MREAELELGRGGGDADRSLGLVIAPGNCGIAWLDRGDRGSLILMSIGQR